LLVKKGGNSTHLWEDWNIANSCNAPCGYRCVLLAEAKITWKANKNITSFYTNIMIMMYSKQSPRGKVMLVPLVFLLLFIICHKEIELRSSSDVLNSLCETSHSVLE